MQYASKELKTLIEDNKDSLAIILGNGVHRYFQNNNLPWETLLCELWNDYVGELSKIPHGISYTEFYDALELTMLKNISQTRTSITSNIQKLKKVTVADLQKAMEEFEKDKIATPNVYKVPNFLDKLKRQHEQLIKSIAIKYDLDYDAIKEMKPADQTVFAISLSANASLKPLLVNNIKRQLAEKLKEWNPNDAIKRMISILYCNNIPLLTTNYDATFEKSFEMTERKLALPNKKRSVDTYPYNYYYTKKGGIGLNSPNDGFGIWHINGMASHSRSIRLGLSDYMGLVERTRGMIHGRDRFGIGLYEGCVDKTTNTWIDIIFKKSLLISGLALEENEVFLRWILIQRAKWVNSTRSAQKGWYIQGPKDNIDEGKKLFLKSVGFDIVKVPDYKVIYEDVWDEFD
ncbi:MAG: SIR2 family protein [Alistipes sp.]|nr:SIR2 family protein [Alistipes sp.]